MEKEFLPFNHQAIIDCFWKNGACSFFEVALNFTVLTLAPSNASFRCYPYLRCGLKLHVLSCCYGFTTVASTLTNADDSGCLQVVFQGTDPKRVRTDLRCHV